MLLKFSCWGNTAIGKQTDMIKKKATLLIFAVLLSANCSDNKITQPKVERHGWVVQHPDLGINDLYAVEFLDENNGWFVGSAGTILHTNDGGISWNKQISPTNSLLYKFCFLSHQNGWAATLDGKIIHTNDAGANWKIIFQDDNLGIQDIQFTDENIGWVGGRGKIEDTSN